MCCRPADYVGVVSLRANRVAGRQMRDRWEVGEGTAQTRHERALGGQSVSALLQRLNQMRFGLGDIDAQWTGRRLLGPGKDIVSKFRATRVDLEHLGTVWWVA